MPEYLDAVAGLVLVETADAAEYVLRIEKFHDPCKLVLQKQKSVCKYSQNCYFCIN